jgi:hypothetical protein
MLQLPNSKDLPIGILAGCFGNTVATYKFYWFLSIIEAVENGKTTISKKEIFIKMVANAWYTVNYFKVSFGKADKIEEVTEAIKKIEKLDIDLERNAIEKRLLNSSSNETEKLLKHFDNNVPHRFLSSWFPNIPDKELKKGVYQLSQQFGNQCLYALHKDKIEINPNWVDYLKLNSGILKGFCFWNLSLFLQVRNPNVPDIPNKLIKSAKRGSLEKLKKGFWDIVINELGSIPCIYSEKELGIGDYVLDHFVPHAFVSHDLIWNLIPADGEENGKKSDKLPQLKKHFDGFYKLQETAFEIIKNKSSKNQVFEDYLTLFPNQIWDRTKLEDTIQPLITIAHNNGFLYFEEKSKI